MYRKLYLLLSNRESFNSSKRRAKSSFGNRNIFKEVLNNRHSISEPKDINLNDYKSGNTSAKETKKLMNIFNLNDNTISEEKPKIKARRVRAKIR